MPPRLMIVNSHGFEVFLRLSNNDASGGGSLFGAIGERTPKGDIFVNS
jgi:hypothetical protein